MPPADRFITEDDRHPAQEKLDDALARLDMGRREIRRLRDKIARQEERFREQEDYIDQLTTIYERQPEPPAWTIEPLVRSGKAHKATPVLLLTDTHFGETVYPEQVFNLNAYNDDIAELRMQRLAAGTIRVLTDYLGKTYSYDGIVIACLGDVVTGWIHRELEETNTAPVMVTVGMATDWIIALIQSLASEFRRVHFVGVVGNHDRTGKKVPAKFRAENSLTWAIYANLVRHFEHDDEITFDIPKSAHGLFDVYDTTFLALHGNDDRGGSGISGAWAPVFRGDYKRSMRGLAASRGAKDPGLVHDITVMGHWHQRIVTPTFIVGNTLKGYDEYAFVNSFAYSPPSQELLVVTPERGISFGTPVWVLDREAEGW